MGIKIDIDIGGVRLPKVNDLRFVRIDTRSGKKQNKDEYLLSELIYPVFSYEFDKKQKYNIGDSILNQIITKYTINKVELYTSNDVLVSDLTSDLVQARTPVTTDDYGTVNYWNHEIDTTPLFGDYYILLTINSTQLYKSEIFRSQGLTDANGVLIQYYNDTESKSGDGVHYNGSMIFKFWIDGRIYTPEFNEERTIYNSFNFIPEVLKGVAQRYDILEYGTIPWFISEKLNLAIQHDNFKINGIDYIGKGNIRDTNIKSDPLGTLFHKGQLIAQPKNYEQYVSIIATEPEVQNNIIWGDSEDILIWGDSTDRIIYKDE